jgi:DNA-binding response OmpR family regulator
MNSISMRNYQKTDKNYVIGEKKSTSKYKKNLFIIEDDIGIQELYKEFFTLNDWKIIGKSQNGTEGLNEYFKIAKKPSIVILDQNLPGLSGKTIAKEIRKYIPTQKILFVSADCDNFSDVKNLRGTQYLSKPFSLSNLLHKVETLHYLGK